MTVARVLIVAIDDDDMISRLETANGWDVTACRPDGFTTAIGAIHAPTVVLALGSCSAEVLRRAGDVGGVAGLGLIGGELDGHDIELIVEWPELPLLSVVDPSDRASLRSMVDAYLASAHTLTDLMVGPIDDDAVLSAIGQWVERCRRSITRVDDVVFVTEDGWEIHGTRSLPGGQRSPGVVLLHSGRSDRGAFARLERLLVAAGIAVLNIDWRGRGESINLGSYFDLSDAAKFAAWRDALAAVDHLAACADVDEDRIGIVGVVHGAEYAARAAHRDPRVRALVLLTGYRPAESQEGPHLVSGDIDVLYVTSSAHQVTTDAMRDLYGRSPGRSTQYVEYPGGAIGYQLFDLDPSLEPRVVGWLQDVLAVHHDG